ncbi:hypothetical protein [Nannocystis pusilla]|uniref:hypothetical protein n=1 Tax=Nannocystis pusilla TaxID=889268 RepID=UPI003BF0C5EE
MSVLALSAWAMLFTSPSPACDDEATKVVRHIKNADIAFRAKRTRTEVVSRSVEDALSGLRRLGDSGTKCLGENALGELQMTYCRLVTMANDAGFPDDRLVAALSQLVRSDSGSEAEVCAAAPSAGETGTNASVAGSSSTASSGKDSLDTDPSVAAGSDDPRPAGALSEETETAPILMPKPARAPAQVVRRPGWSVGLGFAVGAILGGIGLTIPYFVNGIRANGLAEDLGARCTGSAGDSESCGALKSSAMAAFQATEARRGMAVAGVVVALVGISATVPLAIAVRKNRVAPSPSVSFLASPSSLGFLVRIPLDTSRR